MMKKKRKDRLRYLLMAVIFISLAAMGVTYASWSDGLGANWTLGTGVMDFRYAKDEACWISLVGEDGRALSEAQKAKVGFSADGKEMNVTAAFPFDLGMLTASDALIKIESPVEVGPRGTVNAVELLPADFDGEPMGQLAMRPVGMVLPGGDGAEGLSVFQEIRKSLGSPLTFDWFGATAESDGKALGVVYLRMTESSKEILSGIPREVILEEGDALDFFEEKLVLTYEFIVPMYIEQGNEEVLLLE